MRLDDGARPIDAAGLHLTIGEARDLAGELTRLIDQTELRGQEHDPGGARALEVRVYPDSARLEQGFVASLDPVVWVALVELEATPESELRAHGTGAFATACSLAVTADDYRRRVTAYIESEGMKVAGFTDVEPLSDREREQGVSAATLALARTAGESGAIACDTFYAFRQAEPDGEGLDSSELAVADAGDVEIAVDEVAAWARGWLTDALDRYTDGYTVERIGVAFGLRAADDPASVGYACSDGDLDAQAELFRGALELAERDEDGEE